MKPDTIENPKLIRVLAVSLNLDGVFSRNLVGAMVIKREILVGFWATNNLGTDAMAILVVLEENILILDRSS